MILIYKETEEIMKQTTAKQFRKRNAILACLRSTDSHPSAEWIFDRLKPDFPDLSLGTVYRNLTLFKQGGEIQSLGTVNGVERFDGNTQPHVHFICERCGRVHDLPAMQSPEELLRREASGISVGEVQTIQLCFRGLCQTCISTQSV